MKLSDFDFDLPKNLIAQFPLSKRSSSKLLHLDAQSGKITHHKFSELPNILLPNDLLIFNNTKVIRARMFGQKESGGKVEILVERILDNKTMLAQIRASKPPRPTSKIFLTKNNKLSKIYFTVQERNSAFYTLELHLNKCLKKILTKFGSLPLPPYIEHSPSVNDEIRYQTIFAKKAGAVAAPTAGLHFDKELFAQLKKKKIDVAFITLHVGAGTFQPIRTDTVEEHQMHREYFEIPAITIKKITQTRKKGGRIIAVGTTTVRALESASNTNKFNKIQGDTDIFLYPGKEFHVIDALITNFHLPKSSLIMLVSAFAGQQNIMKAYKIAIDKKYRFFSYGDAMFISKK